MPRQAITDAERLTVGELIAAMARGDTDAVMRHLAPGVVCVTDLGPKRGGRRPIKGRENVARTFVNFARRHLERTTVAPALVNGDLGLIISMDGTVDSVFVFEVEDGLVTALYVVRNPEKLQRVGEPMTLA